MKLVLAAGKLPYYARIKLDVFYAYGTQKYIGIISTNLPTVQENRSIVI